MKKYIVNVGIVLLLIPLLALSYSEKSSVGSSKKPATTPPHTYLRGTMIDEGFEGVFPPTGWDTLDISGQQGGGSPYYWHPDNSGYYNHGGAYGCLSGWGYTIDVWLRILSLDFSGVQNIMLSFWWQGSYYWQVSPNDNGDLFVEVSTDAGASWDTLWTFGDSAMVVQSGAPWPWENWTWYQSTLNLDAYAGLSDVYIAWRNVSNDNADMAFDDVLVDTITSGIGGDNFKSNPYCTVLHKAKPNPANDNTVIYFNLSQTVNTTINIYDRSGRLIRNLINRPLVAGAHTAEWNCRDNYGNAVPSGVYFYNLTADKYRSTKNIIILH